MRTRSLSLGVLLLTIFAVAISYLKFARCIPGGWISPDVYLQGCYTDITALYEARGFSSDIWPYGQGNDSLEYPILSGIGIWLISLITEDGSAGLLGFFRWNLLVIALAYSLVIYQLQRLNSKNALLFSLAPAVITALFINWDIWAIAPLVLALISIERKHFASAGVFLTVSIFFKFFPVIYLVPILLIIWKNGYDRKQFLKGLTLSALVINVPFILTQFDGWLKFYRFNYERGVDFGSIWYLLSLQGTWISNLNWIATPLVAALLIGCYIRYREHLFGNIFLVSVIFFTLNKVYSPQYVLWLTVVAILFFPKNRVFYGLFLIWQAGELLYQFAIWRHLLTVLEESGGISNEIYILFSVLRIVSLLALAAYAIYLLENDFVKSSRSKSNV